MSPQLVGCPPDLAKEGQRDSLARYEGVRMNRSLYVQATPYRAVEIKAEGEAKICLQS